ncbi:hypothetical protein KGA66_11005 [Actinocrinis puniceicyclus]|uniref:YCII-related domain-containing protein n=1 Tax=Actinocrinis puniceicyclus TaxID=977794 RepID=A0A8J8BBX6_9ACTN|nr:hypothetical protein [Actinocrinis puniceicyclus]
MQVQRRLQIIDGSYSADKETLAGLWIISAADEDAALEWARLAACVGRDRAPSDSALDRPFKWQRFGSRPPSPTRPPGRRTSAGPWRGAGRPPPPRCARHPAGCGRAGARRVPAPGGGSATQRRLGDLQFGGGAPEMAVGLLVRDGPGRGGGHVRRGGGCRGADRRGRKEAH